MKRVLAIESESGAKKTCNRAKKNHHLKIDKERQTSRVAREIQLLCILNARTFFTRTYLFNSINNKFAVLFCASKIFDYC